MVAEHLARCHDCRDILALALPATVAIETARVPVPARGGWLRAPVLRWGVVAAGLAVLAIGGLLQYQRARATQTFIAAREAKAPVPEALTAQASHAGESVRPTPSAATVRERRSRMRAACCGFSTNADTISRNKRAAVVPRASFGGRIKQSVQPYAAPSSAGGVETQSQLVAANTPSQAANQPFEYRAMDQKKDVTVDRARAPETTTVERKSPRRLCPKLLRRRQRHLRLRSRCVGPSVTQVVCCVRSIKGEPGQAWM